MARRRFPAPCHLWRAWQLPVCGACLGSLRELVIVETLCNFILVEMEICSESQLLHAMAAALTYFPLSILALPKWDTREVEKRWFLIQPWAPPDTLPASMASLLAGSGFSSPRCSACGVSPTSSFPPVFPASPVLPAKHLAQAADYGRLFRGYWLSRLAPQSDVQSLPRQLAGNLNTLLAALSSVASVAALSTNQTLWEHAVCLKHKAHVIANVLLKWVRGTFCKMLHTFLSNKIQLTLQSACQFCPALALFVWLKPQGNCYE